MFRFLLKVGSFLTMILVCTTSLAIVTAPESDLLMFGTTYDVIYIADIQRGLKMSTGIVTAMQPSWSPNSERIIQIDYQSQEVRVGEFATGVQRVFEFPESGISVEWANDSNLVAFYDTSLYIYDYNRNIMSQHHVTGNIRSVKWLPNNQELLIQVSSNTFRGSIYLWNRITRQTEQIYQGNIYGRMSLSPDGSHLAFSTELYRLNILNLKSGTIRDVRFPNAPLDLVWSPNSQFLAIGTVARIWLHDVSTNAMQQSVIERQPHRLSILRWTDENQLNDFTHDRYSQKSVVYLSSRSNYQTVSMQTPLSISDLSNTNLLAYVAPAQTEILIIQVNGQNVRQINTIPVSTINYYGEGRIMFFHWLP